MYCKIDEFTTNMSFYMINHLVSYRLRTLAIDSSVSANIISISNANR